MKNKKGATLTELIVALAITGIISLPLGAVFYTGYRSFYDESEIVSARNNARDALNSILEDLRKNAESPLVSNDGSKLTVNQDTYYLYSSSFRTLEKNLFNNTVISFENIDSFKAISSGSIITIEIKTVTRNKEEIAVSGSYRVRSFSGSSP